MSELTIERVYPIEAGRLFAFVTEADNLLKWWGPEGAVATEVQLDLTRPGPWALVLDTPRGPYAMRGTVKSVSPPHSVEFTMNVPEKDAPDSIVRFAIRPDGKGGSVFTLTQSGISEQMVAMGKSGWASTLGRLEKALAL
jgi:uncharacterized protein YndB with AHSA1/START domain